jgi:hypothetical protein
MNIIDTIKDAELFADIFRNRETWRTWEVFLRCLFGLPLEPGANAPEGGANAPVGDLAIWTRHTGRSAPLAGGYREAWLVCGRRSGKSMMLALCAVFLACFKDWRPYLGRSAPGASYYGLRAGSPRNAHLGPAGAQRNPGGH